MGFAEDFGQSVFGSKMGVRPILYEMFFNLYAIDSLGADMFPWFIRVHELSILDLVFDFNLFVKWKLSREGNVNDYTCRPDV